MTETSGGELSAYHKAVKAHTEAVQLARETGVIKKPSAGWKLHYAFNDLKQLKLAWPIVVYNLALYDLAGAKVRRDIDSPNPRYLSLLEDPKSVEDIGKAIDVYIGPSAAVRVNLDNIRGFIRDTHNEFVRAGIQPGPFTAVDRHLTRYISYRNDIRGPDLREIASLEYADREWLDIADLGGREVYNPAGEEDFFPDIMRGLSLLEVIQPALSLGRLFKRIGCFNQS